MDRQIANNIGASYESAASRYERSVRATDQDRAADCGVYYTPRWLARHAVTAALAPLLQASDGAPLGAEAVLALRVCDPAMGAGAFLIEAADVLARALLAAWQRAPADGTTHTTAAPANVGSSHDNRSLADARRLVIARCIHGVDADPTAAALARDALVWLANCNDDDCGSVREGASFDGDPRHADPRNDALSDGDPPVGHSGRGVGEEPHHANAGSVAALLLHRLVVGDALVEPHFAADARAHSAAPPLDWAGAFPDVLARKPRERDGAPAGLDAVIGNPPWASFSGRHSRTIAPALAREFGQRFHSFARWPALHSLFVERALELTRPGGGRIGLLLPSALADLDGYAPVRALCRQRARAHAPFDEFGESAFDGVVQPCFLLSLTRTETRAIRERTIGRHGNEHATTPGAGRPFALKPYDAGDDPAPAHAEAPPVTSQQSRRRADEPRAPDRQGDWRAALLRRLGEAPRPPAATFADVGVHTGNCARRLISDEPGAGRVRVREGKDLDPFALRKPRRWIDGSARPGPGEYFNVRNLTHYRDFPILLRQTAARPVAALHEAPAAFRNSLLACRGIAGVDDALVVAWLNSSIVAWFHVVTIREARQRSFPQLKVRHLQALPMPPWLPVGGAAAEPDVIGREAAATGVRIDTASRAPNFARGRPTERPACTVDAMPALAASVCADAPAGALDALDRGVSALFGLVDGDHDALVDNLAELLA